jgi:hypothetical protein
MPASNEIGHLLEEEGHEQSRDMGAVHVGVGHDDDPVVAQRLRIEAVARAAAQCLDKVSNFLICQYLGGRS